MSRNTDQDLLKEKINLETGRIGWPELQRHFARGLLVVVSPELDLVDVAAAFNKDDKQKVAEWMHQQTLVRANDEHARRWESQQAEFWAVVVAPWVLVQETGTRDE